ncbi:hypothetical protein BMF77_04136 [Dolichospermum sp. UHCC 0315A]|nr:hypothetical protein BMF77_04136 [Dolichospermum sp. UHCC 0315A]
MNHEGTKNTKEEGKKKNLFTRQLVLDRLLGEKRSVPGFIDCMSTENYFQTFRSALARIYNKNCKVVGADFLVNQYHLLTFRLFGFPQGYDLGVWANDELLDAQATHSIQIEAIKVPRYQIELGFSDSPVWDKSLQGVVGMAVPAEKKRKGVKAAFRMPTTLLNSELLDAQATHSIQIEAIKVPGYQIELGFSDSPVWDKSLQGVVGMAVPAEKKRKGVKAAFRMPTTLLNSELLDAQATRSIQIEAIKVPGYQIELGFSGSPVWDKPLQEVVGMAVAAEKKREGVKAAFRMPITVLVETGDFLHQAMQQKPINSSRSFNRVQEIKVRELEKRFAILEIDYEAVYNQLNETLDAEFKNKIQLKLKRIEQEMNDVFGELKMVG